MGLSRLPSGFWLGDCRGCLFTKTINTADSMVGYRNEKYLEFGWAAARLDDLLNLIPARLTCLMIVALSGQWMHWPQIVADARRHISPNAGWPEAAMARALNVALAGPRSYDGQVRDLAWVNGDAPARHRRGRDFPRMRHAMECLGACAWRCVGVGWAQHYFLTDTLMRFLLRPPCRHPARLTCLCPMRRELQFLRERTKSRGRTARIRQIHRQRFLQGRSTGQCGTESGSRTGRFSEAVHRVLTPLDFAKPD